MIYLIPSSNVAKLVRSMTLKLIGAQIRRSLGEPTKEGRNKTVCSPTLTAVSIKSDALSSRFVRRQMDPFTLLMLALSVG